MKKTMYTLLTLVAALTIAGCAQSGDKTNETTSPASTAQTSKAAEEQSATIELKEADKSIEKKTVTIKSDSTLYDLMKDNFKIEDKDGFITSIEGKEQDQKESKYWMFTVNGEMGSKGAKDTPVKSGDAIVFTLDAMK